MGFKPAEGKLLVELLEDYRKHGVSIPAATRHIVGVGRVIQLHDEDANESKFDAEYQVDDIVVFELDSILQIKVGKKEYYIIDKFDLFGKIVEDENEENDARNPF